MEFGYDTTLYGGPALTENVVATTSTSAAPNPGPDRAAHDAAASHWDFWG